MLFEGYLLYPYRASAQKNRVRWQWGVLVPQGHGADPARPSRQPHRVPGRAGGAAMLHVRLRFLQLQAPRGRPPVDELASTAHVPFDEGVPRQVDATLRSAELLAGATIPIEPPGVARRRTRRRPALTCRTRLRARGAVAVRRGPSRARPVRRAAAAARRRATTPWPRRARPRDEALRHVADRARTRCWPPTPGAFVSPTDPPEWAQPAVDGVRAASTPGRCWPARTSAPTCCCRRRSSWTTTRRSRRRATIDLFDGTENDEILTLRTHGADRRGEGARRGPPTRGRPRSSTRSTRCRRRSWSGCTARSARCAPSATIAGGAHVHTPAGSDSPGVAPPESTPWWDPAADASVDPETDAVLVGERRRSPRAAACVLRPGPRRPTRRTCSSPACAPPCRRSCTTSTGRARRRVASTTTRPPSCSSRTAASATSGPTSWSRARERAGCWWRGSATCSSPTTASASRWSSRLRARGGLPRRRRGRSTSASAACTWPTSSSTATTGLLLVDAVHRGGAARHALPARARPGRARAAARPRAIDAHGMSPDVGARPAARPGRRDRRRPAGRAGARARLRTRRRLDDGIGLSAAGRRGRRTRAGRRRRARRPAARTVPGTGRKSPDEDRRCCSCSPLAAAAAAAPRRGVARRDRPVPRHDREM